METVNCRGEQKLLEEAAKTYDKHCKLACSMHDTCCILYEEEKKANQQERSTAKPLRGLHVIS